MTKKLPIGNTPEKSARHFRTLPYNGKAVQPKSIVFSFASFDRNHVLFNLGCNSTRPEAMPSEWFISLLDVLKEASAKTVTDLQGSSFELHPVKWKDANAKKPFEDEQFEFWQFRISKAKGRVVGFKIPIESCTVFYIVWLVPHHNLTDSEGYGTAKYYVKPLNAYDRLEKENQELRQKCEKLQDDLNTAKLIIAEI